MLATQATTCHTPRAGVAGLIYIGITEIIGLKQTTFTFSRFTLLLSHVLRMSVLYSEELIFSPWFTRYHQKMSCRLGLTPVAAQEREFCSGAKSCERGTASPWTGTNTACVVFVNSVGTFRIMWFTSQRAEKCTKKCDERAELLFSSKNQLVSISLPHTAHHLTLIQCIPRFFVSTAEFVDYALMRELKAKRRFWRTHVNRK